MALCRARWTVQPAWRDASFRSIEELRTAVLEFIAAWNRDRAHPFRWTFTGYPLQAGAAVESTKAA